MPKVQSFNEEPLELLAKGPTDSRIKYQIWRIKTIAHSILTSPSPWRRFWALFLKQTGLWRWAVIHRNGYKLRFYPSAHTISVYVDPPFHTDDEAFIRSQLTEGDVMIDIGANVGILALAATTAVGDSGRIYALEPHPLTFAYMEGNLALNHAHRVVPLNVAAGAESGTIRFTDTRWDALNHITVSEDEPSIEVPVRRLDELFGDLPKVALLKIDTEGYECSVLEGAQGMLKNVDRVYFEYSKVWYGRYGKTLDDAIRLLEPHGFEIFVVEEDNTILPYDGTPLAGVVNLLAIRTRA